MVTIKKIAELCGVSRGTVDRVLNKRGRVKPETEAAVLAMAKQLGYQPNPAGKALAARKHRPVVGIVLTSEGNPFFDDVIKGIKTAEERYAIYGLQVELKTMRGYHVEDQLALLESFRGTANAIIVNPINDERIAEALNDYVDQGVYVITLNTDIENCRRNCYVGSDYFNGGETACALLELLLGEQASVGIVLGVRHVLGHRLRLEGFQQRMERIPGFHILEVIENNDDEIYSYERTRKMLQDYPDMNALFIAAGGVYGACRAVLSMPERKKLTVVAFDSVPTTVEMMKKGVLHTIIYQHPYRQGHKAMDIAFQYLVNDIKPACSTYILKNEIKMLENL
ncbi:MAG: LacI family DNA-binding transcriptional regulator [Megasphaera sp.]|jgi:LacI family transcriptional regulator|nr:LacI family DNA-binding transcriptional regulator [Megasphaera sp.]MCH4188384.1 LacI family DNA-binding transcriptional regulator [Megasphaera sp.]MCH4218223.1 LacI family DNA-binding transcriptional regulator [Megasphaera sp.]